MSYTKFFQFQAQTLNQLQQDIDLLFQQVDLPPSLKEACYYAVTGSGKRVRPLLVASSFASIVTDDDIQFPIATRKAMLAVELLHSYSLIHDDLPCMDDDELRRGRATCHIKFDEATALLAGDALQALAFEVLTCDFLSVRQGGSEHIDELAMSAKLIATFSPRARRMVSGQMLDLEGEQKTLTEKQLKAIHQDKTGALIEAAVLMGAVSAHASSNQRRALQGFAKKLGLAFQVQDDILDVIVDTNQLGKPAGSDEKLDKSTYVKLMGIEGAMDYAKKLFYQGKDILIDAEFQQDTMLLALADWLWERKR